MSLHGGSKQNYQDLLSVNPLFKQNITNILFKAPRGL